MLGGRKIGLLIARHRWKNFCANDFTKNNVWRCCPQKHFHFSSPSYEFHEYDKRSGYDTGFNIADTRLERVRLGLKQLKIEIKRWKEEMKEILEADPILDYRAGTKFTYRL